MRQYACPRCFLVVPGLFELELQEGLVDMGRAWCCHECAGALLGAAALDPKFIVAVVGERGKPLAVRGHLVEAASA